jgi:hypothetical protein
MRRKFGVRHPEIHKSSRKNNFKLFFRVPRNPLNNVELFRVWAKITLRSDILSMI